MKKNVLFSIVFSVALFLWLISGCFSTKKDAAEDAAETKVAPELTVRVKEQEAERIQQEVVISGKTAPARTVTLRAEIDARVVELGAKRGTKVGEGDLIVVLDERDLPQRLQEAQALLKQRKLEYEAFVDLFAKNFQSETKVAEALTALESARASVEAISIKLDNTQLTAPFKGMLQSRKVEIGDYVRAGDEVAVVIEKDPLIVVGEVTEREINIIHTGKEGYATLASGKRLEGYVRYVAPNADPRSRTFKIELEVPNPGSALPSGETAEIVLPADFIEAHALSPATLSLDDAGEIGIKIVDEDGFVRFFPAKIVKATNDVIWLGDLPQKIRVITVGQGFARIGEHVKVDIEPTDNASSE